MRDAFNAVFIEGDEVGQLMFYGRGAGGDPTAVAVVGDLAQAARNRVAGTRGDRLHLRATNGASARWTTRTASST